MTHRVKIALTVILASFMLFSVAACGETVAETIPGATGSKTSEIDSETVTEAAQSSASPANGTLSGALTLTGSTSMADVATALAETFMAANPGVTVSVGGNGSGEGPTAVNDGTAQIGLLSRDLKEEENAASFDKVIIGFDGIAVIVNSASGVNTLTTEQVTKIFKGEITNWKEVGGADTAIQCIGREAASGTRGAFEELMKIKDEASYAEEQNSTGNVKQAVSANPSAIGYVSISAVDASVTAIKLDGVDPIEENVKSGEYTLQRPFVMISKTGSTDALTTAFLDFVFSDPGMKIVADDGIVPNPGRI